MNLRTNPTGPGEHGRPPPALEADGPFELPPLPWEPHALEPVISQTAVELHHGKHHRGYVSKLNGLIAGTRFADLPLAEIVRETASDPSMRSVFNNAGQAWNHHFFFEGLKAPGPVTVPRHLRAMIDAEFGNVEALIAQIAKAGVERFGSGWAWLGMRGKHLEVSSTPNASSLITTDTTPLFALDVWEHAYYLDYHERRDDYARVALSMLVDWDVVARRAGFL